VYDDIDDNTFMYRNMGKKYRDNFDNVKAGFIVYEDGKYFIYPAKKPKGNTKNYYKIKEEAVKDNPVFKEHPEWLMKNKQAYEPGQSLVKFKLDFDNIPYAISICKENDDKNNDKKRGYMVRSGFVPGKKSFYIILKDKEGSKFEISSEAIENYKRDYNKRSTAWGEDEAKEKFYKFPDASGECKCVFYIEPKKKGEKIEKFGFTPYFRLKYKYSIKHAVLNVQGIDYAKAMFGYIGDKSGSFKSRLSFTDAVASKPYNKETKTEHILAEPKPSSYMDYLVQQEGEYNTYNSDNFKLRGVKQYWIRKQISEKSVEGADGLTSTLNPLKKGTVFNGKVRFKNLTKAELGLLLWSMSLDVGKDKDNPDTGAMKDKNSNEKKCHMNVGKGKPYGYGNIVLGSFKLKRINNPKAYSLDKPLDFDVMDDITDCMETLIKEYKTEANQKLGKDKNIEKIPTIMDFFAMKGVISDGSLIRYMSIDNKEYQSRKKPLPFAQSVSGKK
jgi:CRISPR-associated protein (TIGR03986 family)